MQSRWNQADAAAIRGAFPDLEEDVALRLYSARLITTDPGWAAGSLCGFSLKRDSGEIIAIARVRAAQELGVEQLARFDSEPLAPLAQGSTPEPPEIGQRLRRAGAAGDPGAVEGELLPHALAPARFIDHSQPTGVLALALQQNAAARVEALFGTRVAFLPYARPGLPLARALAEVIDKNPQLEAAIVQWIGLFAFGDDAKSCYEHHVDVASRVDAAVREQVEGRRILDARPVVAMRDAEEIAHVLRGALALPTGDLDRPYRRWILELRSSDEIAHFAGADAGLALATAGPVAVDHAAQLRGTVFIASPPYASAAALEACLREAVETQRRAYLAFADRCAPGVELGELDPTPRVIFLPGIGLFGVGTTRAEARAVADLAELAVRVKIQAVTLGAFAPPPESAVAELELARPSVADESPLAGQAALIAGCSERSRGVAAELLDAGACVLIAGAEREPLDAWQAEAAAQELELETFEADPEDDLDARDALRAATSRFGGVDIVVLDADAIGSRGTEHMLAEALKLLREQSTGGGVIALAREVDVASACNAAAREGADANIRVNRVVLGEPGSGLLGMPVTPAHVGRVVTFLAEARAPITGATLSIGD